MQRQGPARQNADRFKVDFRGISISPNCQSNLGILVGLLCLWCPNMSRQLSKVLMLSESCLADQLLHVQRVGLMAGLVENNGTQHLRPQELAVLRQVSLSLRPCLCTAQMA